MVGGLVPPIFHYREIMKKIKINDIELQIDDGVEVTLDSEGTIKISTKHRNYWYYPQHPYTVTYTQTTPNIAYYSSTKTNDKQILNG
jgi:hypothetical protein